MVSLSEEIARLTTPAPVFDDPEDDIEDETSARLTEKGTEEEFTPLGSSKLRQRAAAHINVTDKKYAGKKTTRKKLDEFEEGDSDSESSIGGEEDTDEEEESDEERDDESAEEADNKESIIGKEEQEGSDMESTGQAGSDMEASGQTESDMESIGQTGSDIEGSGQTGSDIESIGQIGSDMEGSGQTGSDMVSNQEESEGSDLDAIKSFKSELKSKGKTSKPNTEFSYVDDGDYSKYYDSDDNDDSNDDDDEGEVEDNSEEDDDEEEETAEGGVSSFSKTRVDEEIQKGMAARQQLGLWDSLLEGRIKFQKVVTAINSLPQHDDWKLFETKGKNNFTQKVTSVQSMLETLLQKLIHLQSVLLLQNSETQHIETGQKKSTKLDPGAGDDEEEITSESESEGMEKKTMKKSKVPLGTKRKLAREEIPDFLSKRHKDFQGYRDSTLQKWYDKTRLLGGKIGKSFSSFEQSAVKQIEQILTDRERLIKRTQLKRASYRVIGKSAESDIDRGSVDVQIDTKNTESGQDFDPEIFDDSDFYHQQLRELIERKTSDINDPITLSRQWLEIQRLRNKEKKKVDTRASKGRKVRYDVHSKLVNFMAPNETCSWSDEARDDLFKSLFGKRHTTSSDESLVGR